MDSVQMFICNGGSFAFIQKTTVKALGWICCNTHEHLHEMDHSMSSWCIFSVLYYAIQKYLTTCVIILCKYDLHVEI